MNTRTGWGVGLAFGLAMAAGVAAAVDVAAVPTYEQGAQQVRTRMEAAYREVLATYDAAMQAAPADASLAVERCRFIAQYTDDEYGDYVASAPDEFEACQQALEARWKDAPVAQLFALEQLWGEEAVERSEALLAASADWPPAQRRALLTKASEAQEDEAHLRRAGELAVQAVALGETSRLPRALAYLVSRKRGAEATRMLEAAPPAGTSWEAGRRIKAALALPDRRAALRELQRYTGKDWKIDAEVGARARLRAGDLPGARATLAQADAGDEDVRQLRFEIAMAAGDTAAAVATIGFADSEHFAENLQRCIKLASRAPGSLLRGQMPIGLLAILGLTLATALVPGLLLLPVHYRGLLRRAQQRAATPLFESIGLRHAWWAGAVVLAVPMLVAMVADPDLLPSLMGGAVPDGPAAFRVMAWGSAAGLACLLPVFRKVGLRGVLGAWPAWRAASWRVPVAWACVIATGMLVAAWHGHAGSGGETLQTKTMDAMASGGTRAYGMLATLLLMALLVPCFEELAFRGALLAGMSRHVGFGWANALQALAFALAHDDAPRLPFYFVLGLGCGWLVRRTNAIGPAIALHALNNALAFAVMAMRG